MQGRHEAIQKIERQMIELAQLFQDMEAAVVQQEPAIEHIDNKAEDTVVHLNKGNEQLDQAVDKARAARRKKWICLGIVGMSAILALIPFQVLTLPSPHYYHHRCYCHHRRRGHETEKVSILGKRQSQLHHPRLSLLAFFLTLYQPVSFKAIKFSRTVGTQIGVRKCGVRWDAAPTLLLSASIRKSIGVIDIVLRATVG